MRSNPWPVRKDPKYWDMKTGNLKEGYTFHPVNEGYKQVSSIITQKRTGAGRDGTNWKITGKVPIYKEGPSPKAAPAPAPAPAPPPAPKPKPKPKPVQLSKEAATAIGRAKAYEDNVRPNYGNYIIAGDGTVIDNYNRDTIDNTEEASKPYFDDDVDRNEAQAYADKYKLELGDDLKLRAIA